MTAESALKPMAPPAFAGFAGSVQQWELLHPAEPMKPHSTGEFAKPTRQHTP